MLMDFANVFQIVISRHTRVMSMFSFTILEFNYSKYLRFQQFSISKQAFFSYSLFVFYFVHFSLKIYFRWLLAFPSMGVFNKSIFVSL